MGAEKRLEFCVSVLPPTRPAGVRWLASPTGSAPPGQRAAGPIAMGAGGMAKAKSKQVVLRLMSQAGTGYYYTFRTTLKGVREKCAHRHHSRLLPPPPPPPPFCLLVPWPPPLPRAPTPPLPSAATATFPAIATATLTLRQRLHPRLLRRLCRHRRLRPRHHRCHYRLRHHRPLPHHRPHRTVPVPPYCTARPHCNPRRSPANAPRPTRRLQLMKHDPVVNKHVLFKEERIKK